MKISPLPPQPPQGVHISRNYPPFFQKGYGLEGVGGKGDCKSTPCPAPADIFPNCV